MKGTVRFSPRSTGTVCLSLLVFLTGLMVVLPSAQADVRISAPSTSGDSGGSGAGQVREPAGIALSDREGGDLYVADGANQRVDEFTPDGEFVRAFGWKVDAAGPEEELQTCTTATGCLAGEAGSAPGQLDYSDEIAVDNSCAEQQPPLTGSACESFDPSYGDVYVVDQNNFRVEKYGPEGEFLLMFGGEVDRGPHHPGNLCTSEYLAEGDVCGAGVPGTGSSHFYKEEPGTEAGGFKSWYTPGNNSIAVGPDGTAYVGDYGRIQEFEPDGSFAGEFVLPKREPTEEPQFVGSLAVDGSGDLFERSAVVASSRQSLASQVPGVREYDQSRSLLRTFDESGEPAHLALDSAGDLFTADFTGDSAQFLAFRPNGTLFAALTSPLAESPEFVFQPRGIAVGDGAGQLYASTYLHSEAVDPPFGGYERLVMAMPLPAKGAPLISDEQVSDVEPTTATLHAIVNPQQFDTTYRFEYTTTDFSNCGTPSNPACHAVVPAEPDLGAVSRADHVQAPISGLTKGTLYHWRVVAESHCNEAEPAEVCEVHPEESFESLPSVSVRGFATQTVGPELVKLQAELDPNNGLTTHYTVHLGRDTSYSAGAVSGTLQETGANFEPITATFSGLQPNTTYHYQLTATNSNGEVKTVDQTLTTELSVAEEREAEDCPNGSDHGVFGSPLREENNSLALPDCRAYEQVSPVEKNGGQAGNSQGLSPSGEHVIFNSGEAFAGAPADELAAEYVSHRTPSGWLTQAAMARLGGVGYQPVSTGFGAGFYSAELDRWLFLQLNGLAGERTREAASNGFFSLGTVDGSFVAHASPPLSLVEGEPRSHFDFTEILGTSEDLSRIFITTPARLLPGPADPRPDEVGYSTPSRIYEVAGVGGDSPTMKLVAEVPLGLNVEGIASGKSCEIDLGRESHARMASASGTTLVYTAPIEESAGQGCGEGQPNPIGLFVRIGEAAPIQLNVQPPAQCQSPAPCASAAPATPRYDDMSPDGSRLWFTTTQPLIDSDTDSGGDLYFATIEAGHLGELVQASAGEATPSHPTPGQGAGVEEVTKISADGSHAAFIATGVLTGQPNSVGATAASGAKNLYVYDAESGETKFVAQLCSGPEKSGSVVDTACPANGNDAEFFKGGPLSLGSSAQFTPDGDHLLFTSVGRLTPDDSDSVSDLYRYDFSSAQLIRVSFGRDGNDANGNDDVYPVELGNTPEASPYKIAEDESRAISADGSVVIFKTAAPLVSRDTNGGAKANCEIGSPGCDVYEWQEAGHGTCAQAQADGCISLITSGVDPSGSAGSTAVISSSGRDITFQTKADLVPADTDGVGDIYDAREDGGFHYEPPTPPCGSAEACHGPSQSPPAPPKISEGETGGNGKQHLECGKGRHRVTKHGQTRCVPNKSKKHHHKKHKRANTNRGGGK